MRPLAMLVLAVAAPLLGGCVDTDAEAMAAVTTEVTASPPAVATYACGEDGSLTVETLAASVVVTDPKGERVELPASPASQHTRYGQESYAIVIEGPEALYMKAGSPPLTCTR